MKTKLLTGVILLFLSSVCFAQESMPAAAVALNQAYAQAAKENKKVLLIFHASWCGWCKKMTASLNDPSCKKMFDDNYVTVYLDVLEHKGEESKENPGGLDVLKKYEAVDAGLPFWLILDAQGNTLATSAMPPAGSTTAKPSDNVGCPTDPNEVEYFIKVLKATSPLTDNDFAVIRKRFLLNRPAPQKAGTN
ncbi:MAG TPA: thioredoxin family protein [Mucilaginibacter sp.]|jgi:thiol-disulfide isomerase/thioredoxin|nr:thioredoxin family protein [Mucilaginibacter sp.]